MPIRYIITTGETHVPIIVVLGLVGELLSWGASWGTVSSSYWWVWYDPCAAMVALVLFISSATSGVSLSTGRDVCGGEDICGDGAICRR